MAQVPLTTRFIGISENVNLEERKSATLNAETQPYTIADLAATIGTGAQGPQGVEGPAGPPGPVGPAGLEWQGQWVSGTSYVEDDAVGYDGASWFCILATNGTDSPDVDPTHWALLASQGAIGPQGVQGPVGPQGPAGSASSFTQGIGTSTNSSSNPSNVLLYNQNIVNPSASFQTVRLPENAPIGTEIIVRYNTSGSVGDILYVKPFLLGNTISSLQNVNSNNDKYNLSENCNVRFISRGSDYWLVDFITYDNITFNNFKTGPLGMVINENYYETGTTALPLATLQAFPYSLYVEGAKVYRPNITGGGLVYVKVKAAVVFNNVVLVPAVWISMPITTVV